MIGLPVWMKSAVSRPNPNTKAIVTSRGRNVMGLLSGLRAAAYRIEPRRGPGRYGRGPRRGFSITNSRGSCRPLDERRDPRPAPREGPAARGRARLLGRLRDDRHVLGRAEGNRLLRL